MNVCWKRDDHRKHSFHQIDSNTQSTKRKKNRERKMQKKKKTETPQTQCMQSEKAIDRETKQ